MSELGIKGEYIVFYIISFLITMYILQRFLFRPIVKILNDREDSVNKALAQRDELNEKSAHSQEEAQQIINQAKEEARKIIEEARAMVDPEKQNVLKNADELGASIVDRAREQANSILEAGKAEANAESVKILEKILEKAMGNLQISAAEQSRVLENIVNTKL